MEKPKRSEFLSRLTTTLKRAETASFSSSRLDNHINKVPWVAWVTLSGPWVTWTLVYIMVLTYCFYCSQMSEGGILKLHHLRAALHCCCCESVCCARPEPCNSHHVMRDWGETSQTEVQLDQPILAFRRDQRKMAECGCLAAREHYSSPNVLEG